MQARELCLQHINSTLFVHIYGAHFYWDPQIRGNVLKERDVDRLGEIIIYIFFLMWNTPLS